MRSPFSAGLIAGLAAGLAMLGVRAFVSAPSLQELLVDKLLLHVSPSLFSFLLSQVWNLGKTLAVAGATISLALVSGFIAWLGAKIATRRPRLAGVPLPASYIVLAASLWLAVSVLALPILDVGLFGRSVPGDWAGLQAGLVLGAVAFSVAYALVRHATAAPIGQTDAGGRRALLIRGLGWASVLAAAASGVRFLVTTGRHGISTAADIREERTAMPAEITPTGKFYQVTKNLVDPELSASSWRLQLEGSFGRPASLTLGDLRGLPATELTATLECIENPVGGRLISNATWRGVRLRDLLERAGLPANAARVVFRSADGYEESLPVAEAMQPEVLVAYEMNGEPLPREHGFPARVIVPGRYGMKGPKWLETIGVTADAGHAGYWEKRGWDTDAFVKLTSQIAVPASLDPVIAGHPTRAGGVAYSGDKGVSRVEISADGGSTWAEAVVSTSASPYSWALWTADFVIGSGRRRSLVVRAYDGSGNQQTATEQDAPPAGATGLHSRVFYNVKEPG